MRQIVMVQYKNRFGFTGREYAYYAGAPFKKGDKVMVPVMTAEGVQNNLARVSRINVRDSEIASLLHRMRTIPAQEPVDDSPKEEQEKIFDEVI